MEIKMGRILKFNSDKAEEAIARMNEDIAEINNHLANIVEYTIQWYRMLKEQYHVTSVAIEYNHIVDIRTACHEFVLL